MDMVSEVSSEIRRQHRKEYSDAVLSHVDSWLHDFYATQSRRWLEMPSVDEKFDALFGIGSSYLYGYVAGIDHDFGTHATFDEGDSAAQSAGFKQFRLEFGDSSPSFVIARAERFVQKHFEAAEQELKQIKQQDEDVVYVDESGNEIEYDPMPSPEFVHRIATFFATGLNDGIGEAARRVSELMYRIEDSMGAAMSDDPHAVIHLSTAMSDLTPEQRGFGTEIDIVDVLFGQADVPPVIGLGEDGSDDVDGSADSGKGDVKDAGNASNAADGAHIDAHTDTDTNDASSVLASDGMPRDASDAGVAIDDADDGVHVNEDGSVAYDVQVTIDDIIDMCDDPRVSYAMSMSDEACSVAMSAVSDNGFITGIKPDDVDQNTLDIVTTQCMRRTAKFCLENLATASARHWDDYRDDHAEVLRLYAYSYMIHAVGQLAGIDILKEIGEEPLANPDMTQVPDGVDEYLVSYAMSNGIKDWMLDRARQYAVAEFEAADGSNALSDQGTLSAFAGIAVMDAVMDMWNVMTFKCDSNGRPLRDIFGECVEQDDPEHIAQRQEIIEKQRLIAELRRRNGGDQVVDYGVGRDEAVHISGDGSVHVGEAIDVPRDDGVEEHAHMVGGRSRGIGGISLNLFDADDDDDIDMSELPDISALERQLRGVFGTPKNADAADADVDSDDDVGGTAADSVADAIKQQTSVYNIADDGGMRVDLGDSERTTLDEDVVKKPQGKPRKPSRNRSRNKRKKGDGGDEASSGVDGGDGSGNNAAGTA